MKLFALACVPVLLALSAVPAVQTTGHESCRALRASIDDPSPVECPLCGGDAMLHRRRVAWMMATETEFSYHCLRAVTF
jgi:hypothetical protein